MRRILMATLVVGTVFLSGCSMLTVHGPESRDMACTTDNLAPAMDFGFAVQNGLSALSVVAGAEGEQTREVWTAAGILTLIGAGFAYSGFSGLDDTARCRNHINTEFQQLRDGGDFETGDDGGDWTR